MDAALNRYARGSEQLPLEIAAEKIGVSTKALRRRQYVLGVIVERRKGRAPREWSQAMVEDLRRGWGHADTTIKMIASSLRISTSAACKKADELGLGRKAHSRHCGEVHEMRVLSHIARNPGCSSAEIIDALGLEKGTVYVALRRLQEQNRCRRRSKPTYFANTSAMSRSSKTNGS
jgi:hypothetical protein